MQHFYDGQIRRYLLQTIRALSHFTVKYGDGRLVRIPVVYGDADRQAASIMRQNSENKINSTPRIAVYITGLSLDPSRLSDSTFVGKVHVRERAIDEDTGDYTTGEGANYTIERLMPTPFKLDIKADIWAANTDQKLQILEQILVLFNPTLELQTTDNYVDWSSLSVLEIKDLAWSSRSVPVGVDSPIDLATITFTTPIWINPPVKIKQLGIITQIITSLHDGISAPEASYIDGLGTDPIADKAQTGVTLVTRVAVSLSGYSVQVYNSQARLLSKNESVAVEGAGARFNVQTIFSNSVSSYNVTIAKGGSGYNVGDILRIKNTLFEGVDDEELSIVVTEIRSVNDINWTRHGEITEISFNGKAPEKNNNFTNLPSTIIAVNNDVSVNLNIPTRQGTNFSWYTLLNQHPGQYKAGYSQIYLKQPSGNEVIGTIAINPADDSVLTINWDADTRPSDTLIDSQGNLDTDPEHGDGTQYRSGSPGTFDAIINPLTYNPKGPDGLGSVVAGTRYLIIDNIGGGVRDTVSFENKVQRINTDVLYKRVVDLDTKVLVNGSPVTFSAPVPSNLDTGNYVIILDELAPANSEITYELNLNDDGPDAWKNADDTDFIAKANDIIEWNGTQWSVIFAAVDNQDSLVPVYQTNIYTRVQYKWDGVSWTKSFEGEYEEGSWRLRL